MAWGTKEKMIAAGGSVLVAAVGLGVLGTNVFNGVTEQSGPKTVQTSTSTTKEKATPTVNSAAGSGRRTDATPVPNNLTSPVQFDAESTGVGQTATYNLGTNDNQVAIVVGNQITWEGQQASNGTCAEVVLPPNSYYPGMTIDSGRYVVYTVPSNDVQGWENVLADQEAQTQAAHYGCQPRTLEQGQIPVWHSDQPSPVYTKTQGDVKTSANA